MADSARRQSSGEAIPARRRLLERSVVVQEEHDHHRDARRGRDGQEPAALHRQNRRTAPDVPGCGFAWTRRCGASYVCVVLCRSPAMKRFLLAAAVACLLAPAAGAQTRLPTIPPDQYTPEQKKAAEEFLAARKTPVFGPFEPLMHSP